MRDEEMGYKIKEMEVKEREDKILSIIVILAIGVPGVIALIVLTCLMYEMLGI